MNRIGLCVPFTIMNKKSHLLEYIQIHVELIYNDNDEVNAIGLSQKIDCIQIKFHLSFCKMNRGRHTKVENSFQRCNILI